MNTPRTLSDSDIIDALERLSRISPREEFIAEVSSEIESLPLHTLPGEYSWALRFSIGALASIIFLSLGGIGVVAAANGSKPGDPLYPVKKAVEQAQLVITNSPPARAILQAKIAGNRASEMQNVVESQHDGDTLDALSHDYEESVSQTLVELEKATPSSNTVSQNVTEELKKHEQTLETVKTIVPSNSQEPITKAIEASQKGQEAAEAASNNGQIHGQSQENPNPPTQNTHANDKNNERR
ncbi:hypothetical protein HY410_00345 [Candidatus Gottesmanbacteria bacterium]|nr:hypothetical protein [Candidatus Gottesmanbacteria bacterium]